MPALKLLIFPLLPVPTHAVQVSTAQLVVGLYQNRSTSVSEKQTLGSKGWKSSLVLPVLHVAAEENFFVKDKKVVKLRQAYSVLAFRQLFEKFFLKNVPALYLQPLGTLVPLWDGVL